MSVFSNTKDILTLVIGSYVALSGLHTWRKQITGNNEYALAKNILLNTYKYREAMKQLRTSMVWSSEFPEFPDAEYRKLPNKHERRFRQMSHVYKNRWDKFTQIKPILQELIFESEVIWDNTLLNIFNDIQLLESQVQEQIVNYLQTMNPDSDEEKVFPGFPYALASNKENDPYQIEFNLLLNQIEKYIKPILKLQSFEEKIWLFLKSKIGHLIKIIKLNLVATNTLIQ